jgi:hypothetical protein
MKGNASPLKGAARNINNGSNDSSDDVDNNNSSNNNDDEDEEDEDEEAASEPSPAPLPLDDADEYVLPLVVSSSSDFSYYPQPLPPRSQQRMYSSSGTTKDEKMIAGFTCGICCRMLFRAQLMGPCGHNMFCEECVPPLDERASACFSTFKQTLPVRSANNVVDSMVEQAGFLKDEIADEWRSRAAAREAS